MSIIKIRIVNLPQIKAAFGQSPALMNKNLNTAIKQTIFFVQGKAVSNAPIRTGNLRSSARSTFSNLKGTVEFMANYAAFVHDGTSPYTIVPKSAKALFWKGADHPVKRVNHPGIRANPYLRKAVDENQAQIDKFFENAVQDTLDKIGKDTQ